MSNFAIYYLGWLSTDNFLAFHSRILRGWIRNSYEFTRMNKLILLSDYYYYLFFYVQEFETFKRFILLSYFDIYEYVKNKIYYHEF